MTNKPIKIYEDTSENNIANSSRVATSINEDSDFIPQSVYDNLPRLLKEACNLFNDKYERDIFLIGALTMLGGSYHNLEAYNDVDKKKVATNLLSFIIAPPASGKGVLKYAKKLVGEIRKTFAKKQLGSKGVNQLIIPANISSAGLMKLLNKNEGVGLIIESEMDTLINANKQDWGNYSDILRNSFENEDCSSYRKTEDILYQIENPKLSVALSGTPNQFKSLMYSPENGLFSRGCYYAHNDNNENLKCYDRINSAIDLDEQFVKLSEKANDFYNTHLQFENIQIIFSREQLAKVQTILQDEYNQIKDLPDLRANINRSFIIVQKIAALLCFLENAENNSIESRLFCSDKILQTAIDFTLTSLKHTYYAYELLPKKNSNALSHSQQKLFNSLPDEFSRSEAINKAEEMKLNIRTIDSYIKVFKEKKLVEIPFHGKFKKAV